MLKDVGNVINVLLGKLVLINLKFMNNKRLTVEQVIKRRADFEELRQLRNLKRNLETGIVFDISPELWKVLLNKDSDQL